MTQGCQESDVIQVNCGRCGNPLQTGVGDIRDKRTITCGYCENHVPQGSHYAAPEASQLIEASA